MLVSEYLDVICECLRLKPAEKIPRTCGTFKKRQKRGVNAANFCQRMTATVKNGSFHPEKPLSHHGVKRTGA
ncbi:MAG: hypothetical protein Q8S96_19355 [Hydrogenophaga sp.]|uniref:hypothetical protein n=1 Tax=Hydrogenophaga sp. TaxID=1904254 RepID=UPI00271DF6D6|nr:hypothetical protein [Hydrogenophaga sp.]MDO9483173.1 hypothetical protein [Hydrogenophaga sp.]MDP3346592.1 hypothetical protein [Hydrogenophaga sp.]MDP3809195.1 hypothetical protein [Hydrogenophaga sp.]MDP3926577.1 hypothetical protein [Hydrogenophaga sp.]